MKVRLLLKVKIPILLLLIGLPGWLWSQSEMEFIRLGEVRSGFRQSIIFVKGDSLRWYFRDLDDSYGPVVDGAAFLKGSKFYSWHPDEEYHEFRINTLGNLRDQLVTKLYTSSIQSPSLHVTNNLFLDTAVGPEILGTVVRHDNGIGKPYHDHFNSKHSKTLVEGVDGRIPSVHIFFGGIDSNDMPVFAVLSKIIQQRNSTFSNNMVRSGLNVDAGLAYNSMSCSHYLLFKLQPNPFGVKEAIEGFFTQLYRMPQFDYTTKEQLDLAKERLAIDYEFQMDRFETRARYTAGFWANDNLELLPSFLDSIEAVTKVDIMKFIRKYLQTQPFLISVKVPHEKREETLEYIKETKDIGDYKVMFDGEKDARIGKEDVLLLRDVGYIFDLTSWASVDVHVYGKKRRVREKRAKAILSYFNARDIENEFKVVFHKSGQRDGSEQVSFSIQSND